MLRKCRDCKLDTALRRQALGLFNINCGRKLRVSILPFLSYRCLLNRPPPKTLLSNAKPIFHRCLLRKTPSNYHEAVEKALNLPRTLHIATNKPVTSPVATRVSNLIIHVTVAPVVWRALSGRGFSAFFLTEDGFLNPIKSLLEIQVTFQIS